MNTRTKRSKRLAAERAGCGCQRDDAAQVIVVCAPCVARMGPTGLAIVGLLAGALRVRVDNDDTREPT